MEPPLEGVLRATHVRQRFVIDPFRQRRRASPRQDEDRRTADPSWSHDHTPGVNQSVVDEPAKPVLAATRTYEEERLDLVAVQVAVRIERYEDGHVPRSE